LNIIPVVWFPAERYPYRGSGPMKLDDAIGPAAKVRDAP